jgi:hypothetical protein
LTPVPRAWGRGEVLAEKPRLKEDEREEEEELEGGRSTQDSVRASEGGGGEISEEKVEVFAEELRLKEDEEEADGMERPRASRWSREELKLATFSSVLPPVFLAMSVPRLPKKDYSIAKKSGRRKVTGNGGRGSGTKD